VRAHRRRICVRLYSRVCTFADAHGRVPQIGAGHAVNIACYLWAVGELVAL
jgi:hypothetical protein